ncbi:MAG TPA: hypothetical protein DEG69_02070, partial [Flavobacteriaceae bacterium]|nr:hypothetical protein [Flavobacteriaceae bacterium]
MENNNMFIKAMEIGFKYDDGISYFDLRDKVQAATNKNIEGSKDKTFLFWFLDNFYSQDLDTITKETDIQKKYRRRDHQFISMIEQKFYLRGETVKQYLDYLELKEAREHSETSHRQSIKAIRIAIASLIITAVLSIVSIVLSVNETTPNYPSPPFEVKVIEDKTNDRKEEITRLKDEL